ncbi:MULTISPECIES: hypothetical protein [Planktothrix]|uniref:hypothetical protein n=1 Tax=Planktothrix TaxID=54304 RepID=UPI00041CC735|nr:MULTISPECIES: hypothetical protein [Planktothrix]
MSKKPKNRKKYCLNNPQNQDFLSLRDELHQALAQEEFIIEINNFQDETIQIIESKNEEKDEPTLRKVLINELNYSDDTSTIERIWKIDLEKELAGISTSSKKTECAILILKKYESSYQLNILLIELKSSLKDQELKNIEEKFSCSMTRLYMLLVLNNHLNSIRGYDEATIYIDFQGILFYKDGRFTDDDSQLYNILKTPDKSGKLTCKTILKTEDKIKIKCVQVLNDDVITISLQTLLSN